MLRSYALDFGALWAVNLLLIPDCPNLLRRRLVRFLAAAATARGRIELGKSLGGHVLGWHAASVRPAGAESNRLLLRLALKKAPRGQVSGVELTRPEAVTGFLLRRWRRFGGV